MRTAIVDDDGGGTGGQRARGRKDPALPQRPKVSLRRFGERRFFTEAENRYTEAVARRDAIRDAWEAEGAPLLAVGSTGQPVEHPLVKMLREHDLLADRLGAVIRKRHRGPQPSAVLKPSPAAKLRAVR